MKFKRKTGFWTLFWAIGLLGAAAARSDADLDRRFSLETIGFLRAWDNADGVFADYVSQAWKEYFLSHPRFKYQDLSKADELISRSKMPLDRVLEDRDLLSQVTKVYRLQSLIRTKIRKTGAQYHVELDWLYPPRMEGLARHEFDLTEEAGTSLLSSTQLKEELKKGLDRLVSSLPFYGHITGVDQQVVTINMGRNHPLHKGDILQVSTLEDVRKHPLLNSISEWNFSPVARLEVEDVDEAMAFCKRLEVEPKREVARFQKITKVTQRPATPPPSPGAYPNESRFEEHPTRAENESGWNTEAPKNGWAGLGLMFESMGRSYGATTAAGASASKKGGGILMGAEVEGQLWLTREFFAEAAFGYGFSSYSQSNASDTTGTETSSGSASLMKIRINAGYTYHLKDSFWGPKGWVRLGYRSTSYSFPDNGADGSWPNTFKGLFLGVGGELPITSKVGGVLSVDFGVLRSYSTPATVDFITTSGITDVSFFLGGFYQLQPRLRLRGGFDFNTGSLNFTEGLSGTTDLGSGSVTSRTMGLAAQLIYFL